MRILVINHTEMTDIGGINKLIRKSSEELVKKGHECIVLSINPGDLDDEEVINGVRVIRIKSPLSKYLYSFSLGVYRFLAENMEKINPDIIHVHHYRSLLSPEVMYFLRNKGYPFIFSPHYERLGHNRTGAKYLFNFYKKVTKKIFNWPVKIVNNSHFTSEILLEDFHVDPEKMVVIPPGVDFIRDLEKEVVYSEKKEILLLSVGVLQEKKGIQYLLEVLSLLKDLSQSSQLDKSFKLTIVGEGDYEPFLKSRARKLGVDDIIHWYRPLSDEELQKKYAEHDIFFLLSREESYGMVVAEALAMGTPCIVSNTTALKEFTDEPGCFGVDYPPDPKKVADLVSDLVKGTVKIGPFSDKIRTWNEISDDYVKIYRSLLAEGA
jgi:glycogen synthase